MICIILKQFNMMMCMSPNLLILSAHIIFCSFSCPGSADRTVKFWDLETFELIGSAGPEVFSHPRQCYSLV